MVFRRSLTAHRNLCTYKIEEITCLCLANLSLHFRGVLKSKHSYKSEHKLLLVSPKELLRVVGKKLSELVHFYADLKIATVNWVVRDDENVPRHLSG